MWVFPCETRLDDRGLFRIERKVGDVLFRHRRLNVAGTNRPGYVCAVGLGLAVGRDLDVHRNSPVSRNSPVAQFKRRPTWDLKRGIRWKMSDGIEVKIDRYARFFQENVDDPFLCCKLDGRGSEEPIVREQEADDPLPVPVREVELLHEMRVILLPVPLSIASESFRIRALKGLHKPSVRQEGEGIGMFDAASNGFPRNHRPRPSLAGGS